MKLFTALKICMPLLGLGALLLLAPSSRAQSEVAPDHFDGTDAWAIALAAKTAAAKPLAPKTMKPVADLSLPGQKNKPSTQAAPQLTPAKDVSQSQRPEVLVVQRKRQRPPAKPNN